MASVRWKGGSGAVAQVNTITPAVVVSGNTFTITINSRTVTFTATAGTVANVTAGLVAACAASSYGEFKEITWADATTAVTATQKTAGKPFTQTSSAAVGTGGGAPTLLTATTTANAGPNAWGTATNWDTSAVPINADDVFIDSSTVPILYDLDQNAVTLNSLTAALSFTATKGLGLPEQNTDGTAYLEYRPQYLKIGATTLDIGGGPQGSGTGRIKIWLQGASTVTVRNTGSGAEANLEAVLLKGSSITSLSVLGGSVGVAVFGPETAAVTTLNVAGSAQVRCGSGTTLTTILMAAGTLDVSSAATTVTIDGGALTFRAGALTTLHARGGTVSYLSNGTITTANLGTGSSLDLSGDLRTKTITTLNMWAGSTFNSPDRIATVTTWTLQDCGIEDVTVKFGKNLSVVVTYL